MKRVKRSLGALHLPRTKPTRRSWPLVPQLRDVSLEQAHWSNIHVDSFLKDFPKWWFCGVSSRLEVRHPSRSEVSKRGLHGADKSKDHAEYTGSAAAKALRCHEWQMCLALLPHEKKIHEWNMSISAWGSGNHWLQSLASLRAIPQADRINFNSTLQALDRASKW